MAEDDPRQIARALTAEQRRVFRAPMQEHDPAVIRGLIDAGLVRASKGSPFGVFTKLGKAVGKELEKDA